MHEQIETFDKIITRMFNIAIKSVKGIKQNIPFSHEKEKRRAAVLYWKIEIRRLKGIAIDSNLKEKRREEAEINDIQSLELNKAKQELEKSKA